MGFFRTTDDDPREHAQLAFAVSDAIDDLCEAGIDPRVGMIQDVLATRGIDIEITEDSDGTSIIRRS